MVLENKLGITESAELARVEEKISKKRAVELFETNLLDSFAPGKFESLSKIHKFLFGELYNFAGEIRKLNNRNICGNEYRTSVQRRKRTQHKN